MASSDLPGTTGSGRDEFLAIPQASQIVRLAIFRACSCFEFGTSENHLSVEIKQVELHRANAIAISYTWGEFDRQDYCLGHLHESPLTTVSINLGLEWSLASFKHRLAQLTTQYGACWLDQICVPQKDEEIRKTLAAIPSIFKTFPVIVLFPGNLCSCLRNAYDEYQAAKDIKANAMSGRTESTLSDAVLKLKEALQGWRCLNSNGLCSWNDRVWPLQELRYSKTILLVWINDKAAECFTENNSAASVNQLGDYSRHLYQKLAIGNGLAHADVVRAIKFRNSVFYLRLQSSIAGNRPTAPRVEEERLELLARFLLGETVSLGNRDDTTSAIVYLLQSFRILASVKSSATKAKDYILSVWVDWPLYDIPQNFMSLSAHELLNNALRQLHQRYSIFVPNTCPAGMMGSNSMTACWYVATDTPERNIRDTRDLYGAFSWINGIGAPDLGRIPLKLFGGMQPSLGQKAQSFTTWADGADVRTILERLVSITRSWAGSTYGQMYEDIQFTQSAERARSLLASSITSEQVEGLKGCLLHLLFPGNSIDMWASSLLGLLINLVEQAILEFVCDVVHLDASTCRKRGVKVIFGQRCPQTNSNLGETQPTTATCIGLVNWDRLHRACLEREKCLTIALRERPHQPYYEAVNIPSSLPPEYAIVGLWLPLDKQIEVSEVGAVMTSNQSNAIVI